MAQTITLKIPFFPTEEQSETLRWMVEEYRDTYNRIMQHIKETKSVPKPLSSRTIRTQFAKRALPSACYSDMSVEVKSDIKKFKYKKFPIKKKSYIKVNNQNIDIGNGYISFPIIVNGKTRKTQFNAYTSERHLRLLDNAKIGAATILKKNKQWYFNLSITIETELQDGNGVVMGVDLGIKNPAVCWITTGKVKFVGNGRENRFIRRRFTEKRKDMQKQGKFRGLAKISGKESRIMRQRNHEYSKQIVDFAEENGVTLIKIGDLSGIRERKVAKKQRRQLHNWAFGQLTNFIIYKANLRGIKAVKVSERYSSQDCPKCHAKNKAKDRTYQCAKCGYRTHRDIVGAMNIAQKQAE